MSLKIGHWMSPWFFSPHSGQCPIAQWPYCWWPGKGSLHIVTRCKDWSLYSDENLHGATFYDLTSCHHDNHVRAPPNQKSNKKHQAENWSLNQRRRWSIKSFLAFPSFVQKQSWGKLMRQKWTCDKRLLKWPNSHMWSPRIAFFSGRSCQSWGNIFWRSARNKQIPHTNPLMTVHCAKWTSRFYFCAKILEKIKQNYCPSTFCNMNYLWRHKNHSKTELVQSNCKFDFPRPCIYLFKNQSSQFNLQKGCLFY